MPLVPWFVLWQSTAPVVATFHTHREQGHRWYPRYRRLFEPLMRRVARPAGGFRRRQAHGVSALSRRVRDRPERHRRGSVSPGPRRARLTCRRTSAHVLYVGRLEPRKGVEHLIHAMAIVQQTGHDARLVVVGDGPDRESLEARGS